MTSGALQHALASYRVPQRSPSAGHVSVHGGHAKAGVEPARPGLAQCCSTLLPASPPQSSSLPSASDATQPHIDIFMPAVAVTSEASTVVNMERGAMSETLTQLHSAGSFAEE